MAPRTLSFLLCAALGVTVSGACGGDLPFAGDDGDGGDSGDGDSGDGGDGGDGPGAEVVYLSPVDHAIRASMALRGIRPTVAELEAVADDPSVLPSLVDQWLDSDEFGATMRDLHNEALLTRGLILPAVEDLAPFTAGRIGLSLGEEPLRLIEHVIVNDRPYTEILTADYTVADDVVALAYGLGYDAAGPEWQETHYTDGRPEAGILSSSTIFIRHRSAGANWHRGRANTLAKALVCYDFLDRDVTIDTSINLADPAVVRDAVVANPACASCHQTLDPLASFFWGYVPNINIGNIAAYPVALYNPATEGRWQNTSRRPPGFFGQDGGDLGELAQLIVDDPRFSLCAAKRFYAFMAQEDLAAVPLALASRLQQELIASGWSAKALARAVVLSDEFRVSHVSEAGEAADALVGVKKIRPEQLARLFFDLTGVRWETNSTVNVRGAPLGRVDLLQNDVIGFRVLAGGIDSEFVVEPSHTYNATSSLLLRAFAAEAAGMVVTRDLAEPDLGKRRLLDAVTADQTDEAGIRAQLARLHARLYGELVAPGSAEVTATWELWSSALARAGGDPVRAWKVTLTAMLQDLRIASF